MMNPMNVFKSNKEKGSLTGLCALALLFLLVPGALSAGEVKFAALPPGSLPFRTGEVLTYDISWSNIVTAGTAVMQVKSEPLPNGKKALRFIAATRSAGLVEKFYKVRDTIESVFDPTIMQSLSITSNISHGKKKRRQTVVFDHGNRTAVSRLNDDPPETLAIPDPVQDAMSSLYYLRTKKNLTIGKVTNIPVHDSGKNWSVEIVTLGKEKITTPLGEFNTIKVKTFPKYEGVFMNKGEIFIWLTDDDRRIPVLMKSTISIGSIMTTLTGVKLDENTPAEKLAPLPDKEATPSGGI